MWRTLLIPALGRQRQADLYEFEASLVYRAVYRTGSKATEKPCLAGVWRGREGGQGILLRLVLAKHRPVRALKVEDGGKISTCPVMSKYMVGEMGEKGSGMVHVLWKEAERKN